MRAAELTRVTVMSTGEGCASKVTETVVGMPQFLAGCWLEISVLCYVSFSLR